MTSERVTGQDLLQWAEMLSGIARTGLGFTESLYEKERYEEILKVAPRKGGVPPPQTPPMGPIGRAP